MKMSNMYKMLNFRMLNFIPARAAQFVLRKDLHTSLSKVEDSEHRKAKKRGPAFLNFDSLAFHADYVACSD